MIDKIKQCDINFNEALFLSRVDHIFIMILDSILEKDMIKVKHYLSDDVYDKFEKLVNEYKEKDITRIFDEMNVKNTTIDNVDITEDKINITVTITSRYMDYFLDNEGNYISGNNTSRIEKEHKIIFTKNKDAKELQEARRCTHCGKTLDINDSGLCPYCNQVTDMSKYDYIITEMELI